MKSPMQQTKLPIGTSKPHFIEGCWTFKSSDGIVQELRFKQVSSGVFEQSSLTKVPRLDKTFIESRIDGELTLNDDGRFFFKQEGVGEVEEGRYVLKNQKLIAYDSDGDERGVFKVCD